MRLFKRKVKLAQSQEAFDAQVSEFLAENGFPDTQEYKQLFAAFIQHSPEDQDYFNPKFIATCIRKQKVKEFAFYVMYPEKRAKVNEEANKPQNTAEAVVSKAQG